MSVWRGHCREATQGAETGRYRKMQRKPIRDGSLGPPANTFQKESENQVLREGVQAKIKIKVSHCIICINEKKIQNYIEIHIHVSSTGLRWRSECGGGSQAGGGSACSTLRGPGSPLLPPAPRSCLPGCCTWGQTEGSRTETRMCGAEAGIVCCSEGAGCSRPHVSFWGSSCV